MCDALGIINFEQNSIDVAGMCDYRTVSAISFLGRYRLIDFTLSNMSNSGIEQIQVYIKNKPRSIIEHIGDGAQYNINPKRGKMHILHGEKRMASEAYNTDIANFMQNMHFIEEVNKPYVIIAPTFMVYRSDYSKVLKEHIASGNDISIMYKPINNAKEHFYECDALKLDDQQRVIGVECNRGKFKSANISMECYVLSKRLFIELVKEASQVSSLYWFKDIVTDSLEEYKVGAISHKGYIACVNNLKSYFNESLEVSTLKRARELFSDDWTFYTKTNDSWPTQYAKEANVKGCAIANGCFIEGTLENCVLGRSVVIKKGAVIKNSILLQGAYIGEDAYLENVIVDKEAIVQTVKKLTGTKEEPVYVKRRDKI